MDQDLRAAIEEVKAAAAESTAAANEASAAARVARQGLDELRSIALKNYQDTNRQILALHRNLGVLWRRVHGSDPPPPDPGKAPDEVAGTIELGPDGKPIHVPSVPPLDDRIEHAESMASQASLELASLEGRMINSFAAINAELKRQSSVMGVGQAGARWLFGTREGWKVLAMMFAALASAYAAARSYVTPAPAPPQVVYVPAPAPTHSGTSY